MFGLFRRRSGRASQVDDGQVLRAVAESRAQMGTLGRLPRGSITGRQAEPAPEYIPEAATPPEDLWAREQARYRAKNEGRPGT